MAVLDYDIEQYQLIEKYLYQFEQGNLKLDRLINVLDALIETFQNADQEWQENLRSEWWTLEQVYAVACDTGEFNFSSETQSLINQTIKNIKSLLKSQLNYVS